MGKRKSGGSNLSIAVETKKEWGAKCVKFRFSPERIKSKVLGVSSVLGLGQS